jgi:hypothetical protein
VSAEVIVPVLTSEELICAPIVAPSMLPLLVQFEPDEPDKTTPVLPVDRIVPALVKFGPNSETPVPSAVIVPVLRKVP